MLWSDEKTQKKTQMIQVLYRASYRRDSSGLPPCFNHYKRYELRSVERSHLKNDRIQYNFTDCIQQQQFADGGAKYISLTIRAIMMILELYMRQIGRWKFIGTTWGRSPCFGVKKRLTWTAEKRFNVKRVALSWTDMPVASSDSGTRTLRRERAAKESKLSVTHFVLVSVCNEKTQRVSLVCYRWQQICTVERMH